MPNGKVLNVKLPEKVEDGQQIRLKGQGLPSPLGGEPGDAIVTVKFARHKQFRRDGATCASTCRSRSTRRCWAARCGCRRWTARWSSTSRPRSNTTKALRLKGKGLHGDGDLYAT
jgi:DnaJ-class molecular chaperone